MSRTFARSPGYARGFALAVSIALVACAPSLPDRRDHGGVCQSDRDCLYGLVCRGAAGVTGQRACVWEEYGDCTSKSQCLAGRTCRDHVCTVECVASKECENGKRCVIGECVVADESNCVLDSDCPFQRDCVAGRCVEKLRSACFRDGDCPVGERCLSGLCR